ncbi:4-hydroxyphenylacetate 3-hydroxylase N-terminal domain-containing protein [Streptomyces sp. NPDC048254]|uniref:4-hydroxyphenylacetate 3-hydroxylase N-terminal domain-containing protein n=1 Tax=Streptomyces sp. NPDC048254 TaxID=3365525 RepID=UPI00371CC385
MTVVPPRIGSDYLSGLKGRRISVSGRLIDDPATEPGFARMAAHLADYIDECRTCPELADTDGTPLAYGLAADGEQLARRGRAFAETARRSGGLMGRSPDFLATVLTGWRAGAEHFGDAADRVIAYWEHARTANLVLTHAISDPPADRHLASAGPVQAVRAVRETPDGLVVRGAKMLATLAPFADDLLVYPFRQLRPEEADQALCFAVPCDAPGLTLHCRPPLGVGDAGVKPLAERFDEMDAVCVFDDVVVPWDRVFIDRDVERANTLRAGTGMTAYAWHQSATRAWVKAEFVFEIAQACAAAAGRTAQPTVREQLGELAGIVETFRALVHSAESGHRTDSRGQVIPDPVPLAAAGMLNAQLYSRAVELLQLVVSSGLVMHPVPADVQAGSPAHEFFDTYFAGADTDGTGHGALLRVAADLALDRFGGRQVLYERVFLGPPNVFRGVFYDHYLAQRSSAMLPRILDRP